jgi:type II secretory ATPase GspE/PulE/Tfp pilus assembly ATPase PilB-like protein
VGEVRDGETAGIVVEAALTGHLVMTSLHANDCASALTRLIDMGIEPFLLSASVSCSIAQRLVRVICPKCIETYTPEPAALTRIGLEPGGEFSRGQGCEYCGKTGFRGRAGVYELLEVSSEIRRMILAGKHSSEIKEAAIEAGMCPLRGDACRKVLEGVTTVEEVIRVTSDR